MTIMMQHDSRETSSRTNNGAETMLGYSVRHDDAGVGASIVDDTDGRSSSRSHPLGQLRTLIPASSREPLAQSIERRTWKRFNVVRPLAEGAMGEVALVRDNDISREVAVKSLHSELQEPELVDRFIDEIHILGQLEHPNIMPIHDVGVDESGKPYFMMKYVAGETLGTIIDKLREKVPHYVGLYTVERRMEIMLGVLRAIEFAHSKGIVHRDVKPDNIMVGRFGEITLMDWGIAKKIGTESETEGEVVGTPLYMSPEQARGENSSIDGGSDLFSATVVFHELLTLDHYLPEYHDIGELVRAVSTRGWRNSMLAWHRSTQRPMPPMELFHFVRRGLQLDPSKRFGTAEEMISRLQALFEGRVPIQCHITLVKSAVRGTGRFVDRHPWLSFTTFAALLGMAGVGLVNLIM